MLPRVGKCTLCGHYRLKCAKRGDFCSSAVQNLYSLHHCSYIDDDNDDNDDDDNDDENQKKKLNCGQMSLILTSAVVLNQV